MNDPADTTKQDDTVTSDVSSNEPTDAARTLQEERPVPSSDVSHLPGDTLPSSPTQSVDGYGETKEDNQELRPPAQAGMTNDESRKTPDTSGLAPGETSTSEKTSHAPSPSAPPSSAPPTQSPPGSPAGSVPQPVKSEKPMSDAPAAKPLGGEPTPLGFAQKKPDTPKEKPVASPLPPSPEKPTPPSVEEQPKKKGGKGKKILFSILGFFLLLGGVAAGYYYFTAQRAQIAAILPPDECENLNQCGAGASTCPDDYRCQWQPQGVLGGYAKCVQDTSCGGGGGGPVPDGQCLNLGPTTGYCESGKSFNDSTCESGTRCGTVTLVDDGLCLKGINDRCKSGRSYNDFTCTATGTRCGKKPDDGGGGGTPISCGDGVCQSTETSYSCPKDCSSDGGGGTGGGGSSSGSVTCQNSGACGGSGGAPECATDERCEYTGGSTGRPICVKDSTCGGSTGGGSSSGTGTIACGTQTCNKSTQVCCFNGCKPADDIPANCQSGGTGTCNQSPKIWSDYSKYPIDKADCEYSAEGATPATKETFRTCYEKYKAAGCSAAGSAQSDLACAKVIRRLATKYGYPSYECGAPIGELAFTNCTNAMGVFEAWCLDDGGTPPVVCSGISKDLADVQIGDEVTFVCDAQASNSESLNYEFRYSINGEEQNSGMVRTNNAATLNVTQTGSYQVECRACLASDSSICSAQWSSAGNQ